MKNNNSIRCNYIIFEEFSFKFKYRDICYYPINLFVHIKFAYQKFLL